MIKTLLLLLILLLLLAFFMAFIPHIGYAYPLHVDEWMHLTYAKTIAETGAISFPDPFTGEGTVGPGTNVWLGYHVLMAIVQKVSGIDWLVLWRFGPSVIFMLTVLCVYIFANKQGYGLEAAFFTCLIPTTVGLLGPAFMVPMALGLLFIPLSLYLAFYVKTWQCYLLFFLIVCFLWFIHPPTATVLTIIMLPYILINLKNGPWHSLFLFISMFIPIAIALSILSERLLQDAVQLLSPQYIAPYAELPALFWLYGLIPVIFAFLGTTFLINKGGRHNYGLLLGLVIMLIIDLIFIQFHYGMEIIYSRGLTTVLLLISIIAGAGLFWVRKFKLPGQIEDTYKHTLLTNFGFALCALAIILILVTTIPIRINTSCYHMIDDEDYRAFVWIKDNIGIDYASPLVDPWKATAFVAVTGKKVVRRIDTGKEQVDDIIYRFLQEGCPDEDFLKDAKVSFVYSRQQCTNNDLIRVRNNVYLTNPNITPLLQSDYDLTNGDFESVYGNPPPNYWRKWSRACEPIFLFPEADDRGGACVAIQLNINEGLKPGGQAAWWQSIKIETGKTYYIAGSIKSENITGSGGVKIVPQWKDATGNWLSQTEIMQYVKGSTGWTHYYGKVTVPPGTSICTIACIMDMCSGTAWFDDIVFKPE